MPLSAGQVATLAARGFPVDGDARNSDDYYLDDGTFSSVVRVRDADGCQWAVKVVDKLLILKHNKANAVLAEKTILLALDHCNIVKLATTFQDSTSLYFVLEYCGGGNLLRHKTVLDARSAVKQLILGVKYLHAAGIVHRDIKPENLLLVHETDGRPVIKIADFGSALVVGNGSLTMALPQRQSLNAELNAFAGTPEYLSPELLQSQLTLETAMALDWWAVGCTAYWILTKGKILFEAATEYLVYKAIEQGLHPSAVRECCEADELLGEIIVGLLEQSVQRRLEFVRERLDELVKGLDA